jgi:hypothetical protein
MTTNTESNKPQELAYFVSNGGELTCSEHGGMYLRSELTRRPKAKVIKTPLDVWERLNSLELATLQAEIGFCCETCWRLTTSKTGA